MKPTELPAQLPKPTFVANVDSANEEIVRLTDQYNALVDPKGTLFQALTDLEAANDAIAKAVKPEDLQAAQEAKQVAEEALATVKLELADVKGKLDAAAGKTLAAAAAAGVAAPVDTPAADALSGKLALPEVTGLQRAINANIELHKPKTA